MVEQSDELATGDRIALLRHDARVAKVPRDIQVGDTVTLPSGALVRITAAVDVKRPWGVVDVGGVWQVRRFLPDQSGSGWQYFFGAGPSPLQLAEGDAKALAQILNRVTPTNR